MAATALASPVRAPLLREGLADPPPQDAISLRPRSLAQRIDGLAGVLVILWLAAVSVEIACEQAALLPLRSPTPAEVAAAAPRAMADWATVQARLVIRLPQAETLEFGAVWATRTGRICGLVNTRDTGVDTMVPFYTLGRTPLLKSDSERRYFRTWPQCKADHWVELHSGAEQTGFCASVHGRSSALGRMIC